MAINTNFFNFALLRDTASTKADFVQQQKYWKQFQKLDKIDLHLQPIRIAILATSTIDHLTSILNFWLSLEGFEPEFYIAEFDTLQQSILDPQNPVYAFKPDITLLFTNYRDVHLEVPPNSDADTIQQTIENAVQNFFNLWATLQSQLNGLIIQNNADIPAEHVHGNLEGASPWGQTSCYRQFNNELTRQTPTGVSIFDIDTLAARFGRDRWSDARFWYHSKHAFSLNATGLVAFHLAKLIAAAKGKAKKALILDLDNTLWGGVVGDDGLEGIELGGTAVGESYIDFQKYLLNLKHRGILLAVCSKNDDATAREVFDKHPEMLLKLNDIAIFVANWHNKADNIQHIAEQLNIGLDACVFVDDNPAERELIRELLPAVATLELPKDPVDYVSTLDRQGYFETITLSEEDQKRGEYYQQQNERSSFKEQFTDLSQYLDNLQMEAVTADFNELNFPRIYQLINKSNQFNLTTIRYSETEIKNILNADNKRGRSYRLKDKFGDNGLIAAVILDLSISETIRIETWVMSCRVLARGMEEVIINDIIELARDLNADKITGTFIPTKKNSLVRELYQRLNFCEKKRTEGTTEWELSVSEQTILRTHHIKIAK